MTLAKRMSLNERVKAELRFEGYRILTPASSIRERIARAQAISFRVIIATSTQPDGTTSARQTPAALKTVFQHFTPYKREDGPDGGISSLKCVFMIGCR